MVVILEVDTELEYKQIKLYKVLNFGYTWGEKLNPSLANEVELEFLFEGIRQ